MYETPLEEAIRIQRKRYKPPFQHSHPTTSVLGDVISRHFDHDPEAIIETFCAALEDSNCYTLAHEIEALAAKHLKG